MLIQGSKARFQVICSLCNTEQNVSEVLSLSYIIFKTAHIISISGVISVMCINIHNWLHNSLTPRVYISGTLTFCFLGSTNMQKLRSLYGGVLLWQVQILRWWCNSFMLYLFTCVYNHRFSASLQRIMKWNVLICYNNFLKRPKVPARPKKLRFWYNIW